MRLMSQACAVVGSALLVIGGLGCSDETGETQATTPAPTQAPVFYGQVERILQDNCLACHLDGRIAPFSLRDYEDVKPLANLIAKVTSERLMPPWLAAETDECQPERGFKGDLRLSEEDISTIQAWADAGGPEGDPADARTTFEPSSFDLDQPDLELEPIAPYTVSADAEGDEFVCFVLDPELTSTRYLNGWQLVPGNANVVHHALIFTDANQESLALADENGRYDCFGGAQLDETSLIGAWAPGFGAETYPANVGTPIEPGSLLVMQIHYHPTGEKEAPDSTKFQMRFTETVPDYQLLIALIGNFEGPGAGMGLLPGPHDRDEIEFRIPAGEPEHRETMWFEIPEGVPDDLWIYGTGTHMHYVGTDMLIDLERKSPKAGEPANECLLQTPRWDFNWQRAYAYDSDIEDLPRVRVGDRLNFRCDFDNSMGNKWVVQALKQQKLAAPVDVWLGEETLDEMCLGAFEVVFPMGSEIVTD
jgi:hypothetical protein